jgi:ABC-type Zn uptake system ZnuABC Zn-binding protein ZnuA
MKKVVFFFLSLLLIAPSVTLSATISCDLTSGDSLHPYFSWVENIVGGTDRVVPLIPLVSDPHTYQPKPADLGHMQDLDVLLINGLGRDEFVGPMLRVTELKGLKINDVVLFEEDIRRNMDGIVQALATASGSGSK